MSATQSLSCFHQWLLSSSDPPCPSRVIVLHGGCAEPLDPLVGEIARYLNEYDGEGAGRWLAATPELVLRISRSPDSRRLLGMGSPCPSCPPDGPCGISKTLTALGRHGYVVFRSDTTRGKPLDLPDAFHAGIGSDDREWDKCHLILNSDLVHSRNLAHMVSDVFLDWHHQVGRTGSPTSSRNAPPSAIQDQTDPPDAASF
jgi:hypothetical protein